MFELFFQFVNISLKFSSKPLNSIIRLKNRIVYTAMHFINGLNCLNDRIPLQSNSIFWLESFSSIVTVYVLCKCNKKTVYFVRPEPFFSALLWKWSKSKYIRPFLSVSICSCVFYLIWAVAREIHWYRFPATQFTDTSRTFINSTVFIRLYTWLSVHIHRFPFDQWIA